jgi:splicing factor 3B subunit 1
LPRGDVEDDEGMAQFGGSKRVTDRESDYSKRRLNRTLSPSRNDAFAMVGSQGSRQRV